MPPGSRDRRMHHEDMYVYPMLYELYRKGAKIEELAASPTCPVSERQLRRRFARLEQRIEKLSGMPARSIPNHRVGELARQATEQWWKEKKAND